MTGIVTTDLLWTSDCDTLAVASSGTWVVIASGGTETNNVDVNVQGTACIQNYSASSTSRGSDFVFAAPLPKNFTNVNVYAWFSFGKLSYLNVKGSTGLRFRLTDSLNNWGEWYLAGSDTLPNPGWICHAVRTSQSFDINSGTLPVLTSITKIGYRCGFNATKAYLYTDAWRYGNKLILEGGTPASAATFGDFYTSDTLNVYGICSKLEGVYFLAGNLDIGKTGATTATYFYDTSQVVVAKDVNVGPNFFEIKGIGSATFPITIFLGAKSGSSGISGCAFRPAGSNKYKVTLSDSLISTFSVRGASFFDANTIALGAYTTSRELISSAIEACSEAYPSTDVVNYTNFINSDAKAVRMVLNHHITNCQFIACPIGIDIVTAGTYSFNALTFTGGTCHVENNSGGSVDINLAGGSNPTLFRSFGAGTIVTHASANLNITVKDSSGAAIPNARVAIYDTTNRVAGAELITIDLTNGSGFYTGVYSGASVASAVVSVRRSSASYGTKYYPVEMPLVITAGTDVNLTITMTQDTAAT